MRKCIYFCLSSLLARLKGGTSSMDTDTNDEIGYVSNNIDPDYLDYDPNSSLALCDNF